MAAQFEKVSKYNDINLPVRSTKNSAGYDFEVAADTIIPSLKKPYELLSRVFAEETGPIGLDSMGVATKSTHTKLTLVPTGVKCKLDPDTYLELSVRSSTPLKYWLILANSVGIIDSDYYNNPDNEGEIFFQLINLSPVDIILHKGDKIGQGIIKKYEVTGDDTASGDRIGGFGSTS